MGRSNAKKSTLPEDQEEHAPRDADPPKDHEAQHFRKRTAPELEDDVKSKVRKVIKPERSASTQKEPGLQSWKPTALNQEKSWHPKKFLPSILNYKSA